MVAAVLTVAGEGAAAFFVLDLVFRYMPVRVQSLEVRIRRTAAVYATVAAVCSAGGLWVQWAVAGIPGAAVGILDWIPWWLLWRFGLRKQFAYLYKSDGGSPVGAPPPDDSN